MKNLNGNPFIVDAFIERCFIRLSIIYPQVILESPYQFHKINIHFVIIIISIQSVVELKGTYSSMIFFLSLIKSFLRQIVSSLKYSTSQIVIGHISYDMIWFNTHKFWHIFSDLTNNYDSNTDCETTKHSLLEGLLHSIRFDLISPILILNDLKTIDNTRPKYLIIALTWPKIEEIGWRMV